MSRLDTRGEAGEAWQSPATYAASHGALGVVLVPDFQTLSGWSRQRQQAIERGTVTVDKLNTRPSVPVVTASPGSSRRLFEGERLRATESLRAGAGPQGRRRLRVEQGEGAVDRRRRERRAALDAERRRRLGRRDPKLKDEYVALGAHYDHVGTTSTGADRIFNGADDDGSGTTALLAMAEALARGQVKTKRSVLFVWHAGEERGLLGSRFFTQFPTVPLDRIVAQLNIDMIGRSRQAGDDTRRPTPA